MSDSVLISVLLPVYNAERTIKEAVDSILVQTYSNFELIIINDGSEDRSEEVILSMNDFRIKYYSNDSNRGLIYTLNRGIELAQGKYIARMDADDIAYPTRFEKQVQVMEENPNIIVCGTQIKGFGSKRAKNFKFVAKEKSEDIKNYLIKESAMAHPTVMIRRKILIDNNIRYNVSYLHAEDYKLWVDLVNLGDFYNIQEVLLKYRLSNTQVTQRWNSIQVKNANKCRKEYICERMNDTQISEAINRDGVTIAILKLIKEKGVSNELLEVFYMSLAYYSLRELAYFFVSMDWIKFRGITILAILKRFIKGKNPVI